MYDCISHELIEPNQEKRYLGTRSACRYCGTEDKSAFGNRTNAHAFPAALGNRFLFSLDECKSCNQKFSVYEDALVKAIAPYLTLGGIKGRTNKVRQTGSSKSPLRIRHRSDEGKRHISIASTGSPSDLVNLNSNTGFLTLRMPVQGDRFVPLHAYKALLKMAVAIMPDEELSHFKGVTACLRECNQLPHSGSLQVGFSYASVGNAPPVLAGALLRRTDAKTRIPYIIFLFVAGSVCFQIWVRSDELDNHAPSEGTLNIKWTSQLPKPEGGYHPIQYGKPIPFDWASLTPIFQPFEAFELVFNPQTREGSFTPIPRNSGE